MLFRGPRLSPDLEIVSFTCRLALKAFVAPLKQHAERTVNVRLGERTLRFISLRDLIIITKMIVLWCGRSHRATWLNS